MSVPSLKYAFTEQMMQMLLPLNDKLKKFKFAVPEQFGLNDEQKNSNVINRQPYILGIPPEVKGIPPKWAGSLFTGPVNGSKGYWRN